MLLTLVSPVPAASGEDPAVEQYVERVPGADGDARTDRTTRRSELPARLERRIRAEGGADAEVLEALAEAPALGAPSARRDGGSGAAGTRPLGASRADAERPSALRAAPSATLHGDAGSVGLLLAGLVLLTLALGGAAVRSRRAGGS